MIKRFFAVLFTVCLLLAVAVTVSAENPGGTDPNTISQVVLDFSDGVPVCPYCGVQPAGGWIPLDEDITQRQDLNGHYYLTGNRTITGYYGVDGGSACIYLGNYNVAATRDYAFQVDNGTMTIMGRGQVTGNHNKYAGVGATVDVVGGTLNLCGGTYSKGVTNACAVVTLRSGSGTVNMYDGTVICDGYADAGNGGNVRISSDATFNMHGGEIRDGSAVSGGNIAIDADGGVFNMYGGTVSGGIAQLADGTDNDGEVYALGGNIYVARGTMNQSQGAAISGGLAYTGGNIYFAGGKTATLAGTVSGGTGKTAGNINLRNGSTMILSEGAMVTGGVATFDGGNIQVYKGVLEITGGTLTGGKAGRWGGSIFADGANARVTLNSGKISGGETTGNHGGNICVDGEAVLQLLGGTVTGGKALHTTEGRGGNLYIGNADVQIKNTAISMGEAYVSGGNIHIQQCTKDILLENCSVEHGTAAAGGNIYTYKTNLKLDGDTALKDGASQWPKGASFAGGGGNLFCQEGEIWVYGQVSGGDANLTGGNLEVRNAYVYIADGAVVSNGMATYDGGNIAVNNKGVLILTGATASGGTAGRNGDNIYSGGSVVLEATAVAKDNGGVYLAGGGLRVYRSFDGNVAVSGLTLPDPLYGATLDEKRFTSVGDSFTGKVWLTQVRDNPCLFGKDGKLFVGAAYTYKDGVKTWYPDNAAAIAGYGEAEYLVPDGDVTLAGGTYVIDLAGQDLKITGSGRVICFDSSNDTYETCGSAVISGPVLKNNLAQMVAGKYYVRIRTGNSYSFHRLNMRISDISLRVSNGGIYYSAQWQCDDAVVSLIDCFGVGVSVADMPTETLRYDSDTLHTNHSRTEFVSGGKQNGVLIRDILSASEANENSIRGKMPIYAKAYVVLDDGTDRVQTVISGDNVAISLHDVLQSIDSQMPLYYSNAKNLQDFRDYWAQNGLTGADWDFEFSVPVSVLQMQQEYAQTEKLTGQLHNRVEGTADLQNWKEQMAAAGVDFTSCLEKDEVRYISGSSWDNATMIGGVEASLHVDGKQVDVNLLFADSRDLEAVLNESGAFQYNAGKITTKAIDQAGFLALKQAVKDHNGLLLMAHPKEQGLIDSKDALDYWFCDGVAIDVFCDGTTEQNYKLWADLLAEGKRVWAAASNGGALQAKANTVTLYASQATASGYMECLASGDYACGPLGMQMMVGDTVMGGSVGFSGKDLVFCVDHAGSGVLQSGHTYRVDLISKEGVLQSWPYTGRAVYEVLDADANQAFYRVEVVDETTGNPIALSNPIWNEEYGLRVGYAREDITPNYTVLIVGGKQRVSKGVKENDGIYMTCVAMQEGSQTYLVYTTDLISADSSRYVASFKQAVSAATGIPVGNIRFSTTHTHSSVGVTTSDWSKLGSEGESNRQRFLKELNEAGVRTAKTAIADLAVVESAYSGAVSDQKDVAFVRHYVKRNGTLDYSNEGGYDVAESILQVYTKNCQYKAHATEADQQIQLVQFRRTGKKDVLLMSVPAHATLNENSEYLSADFPNYARRYIESKTDCLVAYFIGAAGDQVPRSKLSNYYLKQQGLTNNTDAQTYGEKLGAYVVQQLKTGLPQMRSTALKKTTGYFEGQVGTTNFDKIETAKDLMSRYENGADITSELKAAGFVSFDDLRFTIYRWDRVQSLGNENMNMLLTVMAVGEVGFVFAPYEMSGANGTQLKAASPYVTTFIASCTDDSVSYVASQDAFDHDSYEAQCTWFKPGSGELLIRRITEILEQQKYN